MSEDKIVMAHGGGGIKMRQLLDDCIIKRLSNEILNPLADSAIVNIGAERICMTTDGFVVQPLQFPGGDIGTLAVCGTVNDLAVMGARPIGLSLSLIIEEGLKMSTLETIIDSIADTCRQAQVPIITGDTKVVERARGDGLTITTAGVGILDENVRLGTDKITAGDTIIISGYIAEHGLAVMSQREGLAFKTTIRSDAAPLNHLTKELIENVPGIKFMRDPTRTGLAGVVADITEDTALTVELNEADIPITAAVRHAAELLGLDPLTIANEGKCVIVVAEDNAEKTLQICRNNPLGKNAAIIGRVINRMPAIVELNTRAGGKRIVQRPYGEELPRIC